MRALAVAVLTGLLTWPATMAGAVPLPPNQTNTGEWWFVTWDIAKVWAQGAQGQSITVAVLDTGVNPAVAGLANVLGPGTDVTTGSGDGRHDYGADGHGTRMAAFIAGQSTEIGIAPHARILPVVVHNGGGDAATFYADAIRWSVDHGAKVINLSQTSDGAGYPGNCPPPLQGAVKDAIGRGAVIVAAAGNDGGSTNPAYFPAACKGVLAVGAIDLNTRVWSQTERQSYVDVAAPGVRLFAVDAQGREGTSDGTSDASALTSGAIALVWSKFPQLTNRQVVARVLATLRDDASQPGRDNAAGGGIVRPYRAIVDKIPGTAPNPVFDELDTLPPGPPPGSGAPSGAPGGNPSGCLPPPAPGQAQATVGPPPSGGPGGGAPPGPPPCASTAPSADSGGGGGLPLGPVIIGAIGVILVVVAIAVFTGRRRGSPVPATGGFPPQQGVPPYPQANPPYPQGNPPYQQGPPQQGPPPPGWGPGA